MLFILYNFISLAKRNNSFLLPLVSNSTVAVVFGGCPSIDIIVPFPNLSCSTLSPSRNNEESVLMNGTSGLIDGF
jgi:hypothetical protein